MSATESHDDVKLYLNHLTATQVDQMSTSETARELKHSFNTGLQDGLNGELDAWAKDGEDADPTILQSYMSGRDRGAAVRIRRDSKRNRTR